MSFDDTGARTAVRDYYEDCTFRIEADEPVEGREIGPCKKCSRPIWIHAPMCKHCFYDPAVERARIETMIQQRRVEEMQWLVRMVSLAAFAIFFIGFPIALFGLGLKGNDVIRVGSGIGIILFSGVSALVWWLKQS